MKAFASRLGKASFQLAAVGQFKRGKSSLLNTLLGLPVLPAGVVPLTSIPCFLSFAERMNLWVEAADKVAEQQIFSDAAGLSQTLVTYVTEVGNPHNEKQVTRIEIGLPAPLLADGLMLIDTPGIGSAERHNTAAAFSALPECDGALFVFSPDPPLSEAELEYLRAVKANAALVLPVLTKIDTLAGGDRDAVVDYCRRVLAEADVSAEPALVSSATGEGIESLAARLRELSVNERGRLLETAIVRKAAAQFDELTFHNDAALAALGMPLHRLEAAVLEIDAAADRLARHRHAEADLIAGERARLARSQDDEAQTLAEDARGTLMEVLENSLASGASETNAFAAVISCLRVLFAEAFDQASTLQAARLAEIARSAGERLTPALENLRKGAADALGVEARIAVPDLNLASPPSPAWSEREAQRLSPLPPGAVEAILPRAVRQRRVLRRQAGEIDRLVAYNVERLRWTLRQDGNEVLRRLDADIGQTIDAAVAATTDIVQRVQNQYDRTAAVLPMERERRRAWAARLSDARHPH